jgi:hypothetical protein
VAIRVIVELQAKPGRRAELKNLLQSVVATLGPNQSTNAHLCISYRERRSATWLPPAVSPSPATAHSFARF